MAAFQVCACCAKHSRPSRLVCTGCGATAFRLPTEAEQHRVAAAWEHVGNLIAASIPKASPWSTGSAS